MLRVQFTLRKATYTFAPRVWLVGAVAAIGAGVLLSAYVGTLHESVARGEALRQTQRSAHADAAAARDAARAGPRKLVALNP